MSMKLKKVLQKRFTYLPKEIDKHKHNYSVKCVLEITNKNIHASSNYYNKKEYYNVLKCSLCDSFISDPKEGNISGNILSYEYDKSLPLISANTNMKCPAYNFDNLYDVVFKIQEVKKNE